MIRKAVFGVLLVLFVAGGLALFSSPFYWPGITERQTAKLFLEPQNKRIRYGVQLKARWHGSALFDDIVELTGEFLDSKAYDMNVLAAFLDEIDTAPFLQFALQLYSKEELKQKLIGALLLSKTNENQKLASPDLFPFLYSVVRRTYPALNQDVFRANDAFSEVALLAVGNIQGEKSLNLLIDVLSESPVPYTRHKMACRALGKLRDKRAIPILQKKMLDPDFHATLPAYQALLQLGDRHAKEIGRKRISLGLEGDDSLFQDGL